MSGESKPHLGRGDYARILSNMLIAALGLAIIARAVSAGLRSPSVFLMGGAFLALGCYRLWLIRRTVAGAGGRFGPSNTKESRSRERQGG